MRIQLTAVFITTAYLAAAQTPLPDLLSESRGHPALTLDDFIKLALERNPTIQEAEAIVRASEAQARQVGLYPNPSAGYRGEEIRGGSYRGGIEGGFIQQDFVLGGKLGLRKDVYRRQAQEEQTGVVEQRTRILSDVSQMFYSTVAAQQAVTVEKHLLSLASDAVTTAHQLANVGQADAPDVLQAEVEAEQSAVDYSNAQRGYLQAFEMLAALAGNPELPVAPLAGDVEHPPQIDAQNIADVIVRESPSVKRAQQDVARAEAELRSARRESVPDLQISAGAENNFEPLNLAPRHDVGVHAFVTAGVTLPLFNRNQGNVSAAAADLAHAQAELHRIQLSLRRDTQTLLQTYLASKFEAERYRTAMLPRAERAYQLYLDKYRSMAAAYPQVLVSQRTLFQLEVNYVHVLEAVWKSAIALQNFNLSAGLSAPFAAQDITEKSNLPNSGNSGTP